MLNVFLLFANKFLLLRFLRPWLIPQLLQKSQKNPAVKGRIFGTSPGGNRTHIKGTGNLRPIH